ncbi:hypothetical protein [Haliovirga abyssi]|uniref:Uncharacterized protein n=1 Tax=Haliovirga abyssi TaxID=2996794 RepID=A0AAU9DKH5_9FUSO|nr:hypothetical protein [Haliovirga abyssi]BDU50397.1 hypothetical protein HLVA_09660 [Haliovirga abyssi]
MKWEIDVNKERNEILLFDKKGINGRYKFYYDETNNFRKFWIKENKFNASTNKNFVLAGLVHEDVEVLPNIEDLFGKLKLQSNVKELKFKMISKGKFLECCKSQKLNIILKYIYENKIYLHYVKLDPFYYSIVDIIDSILENEYMDFSFELKNCLYKIMYADIEKTTELFLKHDYPNIKKDIKNEFIDDLLDMINESEVKNMMKNFLIELLKKSREKEELPFIMDNLNNNK